MSTVLPNITSHKMTFLLYEEVWIYGSNTKREIAPSSMVSYMLRVNNIINLNLPLWTVFPNRPMPETYQHGVFAGYILFCVTQKTSPPRTLQLCRLARLSSGPRVSERCITRALNAPHKAILDSPVPLPAAPLIWLQCHHTSPCAY